MAIASASQVTTATAAAAAAWEVRSASTNKPKIMEVGLSQNVAGSTAVFGLGRPAAIGVTPTTPVTFLDESDGGTGTPGDNAPAALTTCAVAWGTGPTVPANFFRRIALPSTIGAGVIWTFPRGLGLAVSNSIVVWIIATAVATNVWAVCDE